MKYVEFKKFTDENGARPIYLFEGEEVYFREKGTDLLKGRFVQEPTLDYVSYDGAALKGDKLKTLVDAVRSFPFISQKRLVRVTEFYPTEKDFDTYLKALFNDPPTESILLILNSGKGKNCAALAKKANVTYVDCSRSDEETIKKWIYVTCKRAGVYADGITCGKIASYCTSNMSRVAMETEKLLVYCQAEGKDRLTDEIVDMMVYPDAEYKLYEIANALSRKNYAEYIKIINDLSTRGFNESVLIASMTNYFKTLYETSLCKGSDKEVALALGIKEYAARKNREQAAKFTKQELLDVYENVYQAGCNIRSGVWTPAAALKAVTARLFFK